MLFDVKFAKSFSSLLSSIVLSISSLLCVFGDISEILQIGEAIIIAIVFLN